MIPLFADIFFGGFADHRNDRHDRRVAHNRQANERAYAQEAESKPFVVIEPSSVNLVADKLADECSARGVLDAHGYDYPRRTNAGDSVRYTARCDWLSRLSVDVLSRLSHYYLTSRVETNRLIVQYY